MFGLVHGLVQMCFAKKEYSVALLGLTEVGKTVSGLMSSILMSDIGRESEVHIQWRHNEENYSHCRIKW